MSFPTPVGIVSYDIDRSTSQFITTVRHTDTDTDHARTHARTHAPTTRRPTAHCPTQNISMRGSPSLHPERVTEPLLSPAREPYSEDFDESLDQFPYGSNFNKFQIATIQFL